MATNGPFAGITIQTAPATPAALLLFGLGLGQARPDPARSFRHGHADDGWMTPSPLSLSRRVR